MKTILLLFLSTLFTVVVSAQQTENAMYKTIADQFEKQYNTGNYDAVFNSFSPTMQAALPVKKTTAFLTGLKQQAGNITQRTFMSFNKGYASYKSVFERGLFTLSISIDSSRKIDGLLFQPFKDDSQRKPARNTTKLILPFTNEWTVIWGGDTKDLNYHVENEAQKNAFDMVITNKKGNSYNTNGKTNPDYYAFGKELVAPCDGEIVMVIEGIADNVPGTMNRENVTGNTVMIKTANEEYLVLAHFKQNSIAVKKGEKVKKGQLLGLCGNSGNSSEPHLHFHIQNTDNLYSATGIKCYFERINVNGKVQTDYSPVRNDKISNP